MKYLIFSLCLLPLLAFQTEDSLSDITKAINSGNATTLGQYFDEQVEVALLSQESVYSKSQAINKLQTFFNQHKPKNFNQVHEGNSKGNGSKYCIGNLQTDAAEYRVYMFINVIEGKYKIQELRIE